jgi:hypothetical protein
MVTFTLNPVALSNFAAASLRHQLVAIPMLNTKSILQKPSKLMERKKLHP